MKEKDKWGLNWDTWINARFKCVYCGFDGMGGLLAAHQLTTDHIRPRCRDGKDDQDNLAAACCCCNSIKSEWDRSVYDPEEFAGRPTGEVREAAKAYIDGWYRKWNTGYDEMMREARK
jgi:5-methylcytosine-specific restriction endonuclease McrA